MNTFGTDPNGGSQVNRSDRSNIANRSERHPLDRVLEWFERFIVTSSEDDLHILTLWTAHTWLIDALPSTPRLQIDSIAPGSGKSTSLEHMGRLGKDPAHMASITSAALLSRMIDARPRTLLLDEVDRALDPTADLTKELISILNSGYRKGATRPVLVPVKGGDWEAKEMSTYAPVAMAGNSPRLPDDTRSRIIRIVLMPDVQGKAEETNWEDHAEDAEALGAELSAWAESVEEEVRASRPTMPDGCVGRNRERWAPLLRVALAAGGPWPARVHELITRDMDEQQLLRDEGLQRIPPAVQLVIDIRDQFEESGESFIETTRLTQRLIKDNPSMWSSMSDYGKDLTVQRLGRMLSSSWRVHSIQRPDGSRARGYLKSHFAPAFRQVAGMVPNSSKGSNSPNGSPEGVSGSPDVPTYLPVPQLQKEYAA